LLDIFFFCIFVSTTSNFVHYRWKLKASHKG